MKRTKYHHSHNQMYQDGENFSTRLAAELNNVGVSMQELGEYTRAITLYSEAISALKEASFHGGNRVVPNRFAQIMEAKEKLGSLEPSNRENIRCKDAADKIHISETCFLSQPLKIDSKTCVSSGNANENRHVRHEAIIWNNVGIIHYKRGRPDLAKETFERALDLFLEEDGNSAFGCLIFALLHNNLGHIYHHEGLRNKASKSFAESWRLGQEFCFLGFECEDILHAMSSRSGENPEHVAKSYLSAILYNKGHMSSLDGRYDNAFNDFSDALELASTKSVAIKIISSIHAIGQKFQMKEDHKEAIKVYKKALKATIKMVEITKALPARIYSTILQDMGATFYQMGHYRNATQALVCSLRVMKMCLGNNDPFVLWSKHRIRLIMTLAQVTGTVPDVASAA